MHYKLISQPPSLIPDRSHSHPRMVDRAISITEAILCNEDLINTLASAINRQNNVEREVDSLFNRRVSPAAGTSRSSPISGPRYNLRRHFRRDRPRYFFFLLKKVHHYIFWPEKQPYANTYMHNCQIAQSKIIDRKKIIKKPQQFMRLITYS